MQKQQRSSFFKRSLSEQHFGRSDAELIYQKQRPKVSMPTLALGSNSAQHSLTNAHRSSSMADLGARMKSVGHAMKTAAEDELRYEIIRFAARTTAHGIPMAAHATRWYAKWMWMAISLASVGIFCYNVHGVLEKYWRKDKITTVQLRFDNVPFPAITVCNLNPFKRELARRVPEISETLEAFHQAVTYSKHADQHYDETAAVRERRNIQGGFRYVQYEPVMSDCACLEGYFGVGRMDCAQLDTVPKDNVSLCICNYDRQDSSVWPCYSKASWIEAMCPDCNDIGYCNLPDTNGTNPLPCLCQKNINYCLLRPERMKRIWEIRGRVIPEEGSPFRSDFLDQLKELGYENMTDEVAITTKTLEKLVLTMAGLPAERRIALSYGRSEFIRMCSFNGHQCNIQNDFKLHVDPGFGNCYTFNANREKPLGSSRAGPSYGLRLLVHINTSDYLPTTQSAGVRIAIHSQDEHPFPDAFGYSAPTNMLSSFGIGLRKVTRLPIPEGECLMPDHPLPNWYIYKDYKYEPEGCYKSCYQNQIILRCGCADPRYPSPNNYTKVCNSLDALSRNCLLVESSKFTRAQQCFCKHPCQHDLYTPTFSSARLTPEAFKASSSSCSSAKAICHEFNAESAVLLEIYYEQMSHEVLSESESYMFVNFVSDVGGQAGLWLGASILTLFEVIVFVLRILTIFCRRRFRRGVAVGDDDFSSSNDGQQSSEIVHKKGPSVVESRRAKTLSQRLKKAAKQRLRKVSSIPSVGAVTVGSPPILVKNTKNAAAAKLRHDSTSEFFIGSANDLAACQKNNGGIGIVKEEEDEQQQQNINNDDDDDNNDEGNVYVSLTKVAKL